MDGAVGRGGAGTARDGRGKGAGRAWTREHGGCGSTERCGSTGGSHTALLCALLYTALPCATLRCPTLGCRHNGAPGTTGLRGNGAPGTTGLRGQRGSGHNGAAGTTAQNRRAKGEGRTPRRAQGQSGRALEGNRAGRRGNRAARSQGVAAQLLRRAHGARRRTRARTRARGHVGTAWLLRPCGPRKRGPPHATGHDNPQLCCPRIARRHRPHGRHMTPPPGPRRRLKIGRSATREAATADSHVTDD